jgi:hypothetical protein
MHKIISPGISASFFLYSPRARARPLLAEEVFIFEKRSQFLGFEPKIQLDSCGDLLPGAPYQPLILAELI